VALSFHDWTDARVAPAWVEVPVVAADATEAKHKP
jgi:hypothetical protein